MNAVAIIIVVILVLIVVSYFIFYGKESKVIPPSQKTLKNAECIGDNKEENYTFSEPKSVKDILEKLKNTVSQYIKTLRVSKEDFVLSTNVVIDPTKIDPNAFYYMGFRKTSNVLTPGNPPSFKWCEEFPDVVYKKLDPPQAIIGPTGWTVIKNLDKRAPYKLNIDGDVTCATTPSGACMWQPNDDAALNLINSPTFNPTTIYTCKGNTEPWCKQALPYLKPDFAFSLLTNRTEFNTYSINNTNRVFVKGISAVGCWIKLNPDVTDSIRPGIIMGNYDTFPNQINVEIHQYRRPRIYINRGAINWLPNDNLPLDTWTHILFNISSPSTIDYYRDGILKESFSGVIPSITNITNIKYGYDNRGSDVSANAPNFKIANMFISETPITSDTVKSLTSYVPKV